MSLGNHAGSLVVESGELVGVSVCLCYLMPHLRALAHTVITDCTFYSESIDSKLLLILHLLITLFMV